MRNPLLSDIDDAITEHLIENGNMLRKHSEANKRNQWTSKGYVARVERLTCAHCRSVSLHVAGVFYREENGLGDLREQRLTRGWQIPLKTPHLTEWTPVEISECPNCLSARGFRFPVFPS